MKKTYKARIRDPRDYLTLKCGSWWDYTERAEFKFDGIYQPRDESNCDIGFRLYWEGK